MTASNAAVAQDHTAQSSSRAAALRRATAALHAQVDAAVMAGQPLDDRGRYARFLATQYRFHQLAPAFFQDEALNQWFPGLAGRNRLAAVEQDCRDLGVDTAALREAALPAPRGAADRAAAVGWLYVIEGSNLGAAFLYKRALLLGLSAEFGARHLAPHADGRAPHWHQFVAQLDAAPVAAQDEAQTLEGARQAFARVIAFARAAAMA